MLLLLGVLIETVKYQETFPTQYAPLGEAWHYSVLSMKHGLAFFVVFFIPTFVVNYCICKIFN